MSLPGVNTNIKDRFFGLSRTNTPTGPRVLAIGTRDTADGTEDVPDLDPYIATSEEKVIDAFGEGSQLHRAYLELLSGGAQQIILLALPEDTVFTHSTGTLASATHDAATDTDLFDDLFDAVESAQPDIVVPWGRGGHPSEYSDDGATVTDAEIGFHADNSASLGSSWVAKIADKMAEITGRSNPCFAVMGIAPYTGSAESMTPSQVSSHLNLTTLTDRDNVTAGMYVSVVATELKPLGYPDEYGYSNGACYYAGAISQLAPQSSPTGKVVFRVEKLRYAPTNPLKQDLIDVGVVPVGIDFNRNPQWIDALTFTKVTSDFRRLTTLRIAFDAIQLVRQATHTYIGEASSISARNSMETAITGALRGMQIAGALLASDFTVTYIGTENKAVVDLVLTPAFETRNIEISVSVQL